MLKAHYADYLFLGGGRLAASRARFHDGSLTARDITEFKFKFNPGEQVVSTKRRQSNSCRQTRAQ